MNSSSTRVAYDDTDLASARALFDEKYYLSANADVQSSGQDPWWHYLNIGWWEGRDPSASFDSRYYWHENKEVQEAGICPLVHYAARGITDGLWPTRRPEPGSAPTSFAPGDLIRETILNAVPGGKRKLAWLRPLTQTPLDLDSLQSKLKNLVSGDYRGIVMSLSHDDYVTVVGGVQNCVNLEEKALSAAGWAYIHLCPAQPLPCLADITDSDEFLACVRINSQPIGLARISDIASAIVSARQGGVPMHFVVHHLLGWSPEVVAQLAAATSPDKTYAWVHDFFTMCSSFALLRNDYKFCHAPEVNSEACKICCYGVDRQSHVDRIRSLFADLQPTVVAPSEAALSFWLAHANYKFSDVLVVPHGQLKMEAGELDPGVVKSAIRVGFLGQPAIHKGWSVFAKLASQLADDPRYAFFHLGMWTKSESNKVSFIEVNATRDDPEAMTAAIRANDIDVVVNWSFCYETFSFTAHEAVAGGAYVITRRDAGNVWPAVSRPEIAQGHGLATEDELFDLFVSGHIFNLIGRRRRGSFILGNVTGNLLLGALADV